MNPLFDFASVCATLRKGIEKGYWTLEDLDEPSPGWKLVSKEFAFKHPHFKQSEYKNPLRDQFQNDEKIQITDPRDFVPKVEGLKKSSLLSNQENIPEDDFIL
jgi:hypothetical protein